jgi:phosphate uptake regulator
MPRNSRREVCQGDDAIDQLQDSASREIAEAPRPSGMATYHRNEEVHGFPIDEVSWTWTRYLRNALEYSTSAGSSVLHRRER